MKFRFFYDFIYPEFSVIAENNVFHGLQEENHDFLRPITDEKNHLLEHLLEIDKSFALFMLILFLIPILYYLKHHNKKINKFVFSKPKLENSMFKGIFAAAVLLFVFGFGIKTSEIYEGDMFVSHSFKSYATPQCVNNGTSHSWYVDFATSAMSGLSEPALFPSAAILKRHEIPEGYKPDDKCKNANGFVANESNLSMDFIRFLVGVFRQ